MPPGNPERLTLLVDENNDSVVDPVLDAVRVTMVGGGPASSVLITDIEDGAGDSVMDPVNDAIRVNIVAGAGSGGTAQADKSTFTEGTTSFTPVGGVFNETLAGDVAEDQAAAARITRRRAVHTNLRNNDGTEVGTATDPVRTDPTGTTSQPVTDGGGSLTVDGTVAVSGVAGTVAVDQVDTASLDYDTGAGTVNQTVLGIALPSAGGPVAGGTLTNPVRVDPTGTTAQPVTDNGGSLTVDGTVALSGGSVVVTDIEDGAGDSVMDAANDAIRVNVVAGGGSGVSHQDKTTFTEGTDDFVPVGGVFNDSLGGDLAEDEAGAARVTRRRAVHANLRDNDGVEVGTAGAPLRTDPTGSTAQPVTDGGGSLTVDGTVAVSSVGGTVTVDQVDTASLDYDTGGGTVNQTVLGIALPGPGGPVAGGTATDPVRTDPTGSTTQPVSGTVAVSAISSALPAGDNTVGRVKLTDGTDVASIRDLTNADPLDVAIVDANGDQITSFGGGTQYTDGDVDPTPTGTAVVWRDTGDEMRVASAEKPLPVNVVEGGSGSSADIITRYGFQTLVVYDPTTRKMLEQILLELADLKRQIFET